MIEKYFKNMVHNLVPSRWPVTKSLAHSGVTKQNNTKMAALQERKLQEGQQLLKEAEKL